MSAFIPQHYKGSGALSRNSSHRFHASNSEAAPNECTSSFRQTVEKGCTVPEALQSSIQLLQHLSIPEPEESVLHLLLSALDLSWESGYRDLRELLEITSSQKKHASELASQVLTADQSTTFISLLDRRCQLEPIQYIVGKWDFHMLSELAIRKPMLCPRPETEELVELVLNDVRRLKLERGNNDDRIRILDVGAGTGAIGIALTNQYPNDVQVVALDILPEAVELSNQNADKFLSPIISDAVNNDVRQLYHAILCSADDYTNASKQQYNMNFDIVVSNPPYIPAIDMESLTMDVLKYESHEALCGGNDGLDIIRVIVQRLPEWMKGAKSRQKYCWLEVDDSHLEKWLFPGSDESNRLGVEYCAEYQDLYGRERFVKLMVSNNGTD
jgi:release factor glutamine methyltransferase